MEAVRITAYVLQRIRLLRLALEAQLSRRRILASHVPGKALVDALLLGIEGVYVQLIATDVTCVGTVEQHSVVVPAECGRWIALGTAGELCRQTHIAQLHGQRIHNPWWTSDHHMKCLSIAWCGAEVVALMQCLAHVGYLQGDAVVAQLGERVVRMLQPPVYGHVIRNSATLQQQLATAGHIQGGILQRWQQLRLSPSDACRRRIHVHLPHELAMASVRILVLRNASAKEKENKKKKPISHIRISTWTVGTGQDHSQGEGEGEDAACRRCVVLINAYIC